MRGFEQLVWVFLLVIGLCYKDHVKGLLIPPDLPEEGMPRSWTLQHMGCFDLNYALAMSYHRHISDVTLNKCITLCGYRHTKYAGVEKSDNFCYCGGDIAEGSLKRNDSLCNVQCPDNSSAVCGGDWLMSVYLISELNTTPTRNTTDSSEATQTTTLSPTTNIPTSKFPDLKFLVSVSNGISMYDSSNLNNFDYIMTSFDWVYSVDYHLSKNLAFGFVNKRIYKSRLVERKSGADAAPAILFNTPTVVKDVSKCDGFAVDWVNDRIYWANCELKSVTIMSCDLTGGKPSTILKRPGDPVNVKNMVVDPYEKMLFWTGDGVIESCTFSGSNLQTNMTNSETTVVRSLALDLTARRLYYTDVESSVCSVNSMDYLGNEHHKHFRLAQLNSVYGLGVFRGYVYWVNFAGNRDIIYQAPLNTTNQAQVQSLKTVERAVWHMRLVHPDLQTQPGANPCDNKQCSYRCIPDSLTARCLCPQGLQLDNKGTTCLNSTQNIDDLVPTTSSPVGTNKKSAISQARTRSRRDHSSALLLVLLVGATVMLVLGLLYFGNHHWSSIQAKLSRVPYLRQEQPSDIRVNPQFDITDDNVHLI